MSEANATMAQRLNRLQALRSSCGDAKTGPGCISTADPFAGDLWLPLVNETPLIVHPFLLDAVQGD